MGQKKKVFFIIILAIAIVVLGSISAIYLFDYGQTDPFNFIFNNFISITSFVLSFLALIIAFVTYTTIDSVDSATKMEGNVFENEDYSIEYSSLVDFFGHQTSQEKSNPRQDLINNFSIALTNNKKYKNCLSFTNHLQNTIDNLVWLNFIDIRNGEIDEACIKFIQNSIRQVRYFENINSGLEYLLDENIKLIISVLNLCTGKDLLRNSDKEDKGINRLRNEIFYKMYIEQKYSNCKIQNVRGKMAKNPLTTIVYYDFLGKKFLSRVVEDRDTGCLLSFEEIISRLKNIKADDFFMNQFEILTKKAIQCFKVANEAAQSNMIWKAIIAEDLLYANIIALYFNKKDHADLPFDEAINCWKETYYLLNADRIRKGSYLIDQICGKQKIIEDLRRNIDLSCGYSV